MAESPAIQARFRGAVGSEVYTRQQKGGARVGKFLRRVMGEGRPGLGGADARLAGLRLHELGAAQLVSAPLGAEVINLEDDTNLGTTPVRVWWQARSGDPRYISVRFQKEGFQDKVTAFWVNMRHGSKDSAMSNAVQVKVELDKKRGAR